MIYLLVPIVLMGCMIAIGIIVSMLVEVRNKKDDDFKIYLDDAIVERIKRE